MLRHSFRVLCAATVVVAFLTSCATMEQTYHTDDDASAPLLGMVYDSVHRPVSGAEVILSPEIAAIADVNGRFVFPPIPLTEYHVRITRDGYEPATFLFDFRDDTQVLYVRLVSTEWLENEAVAAIGRREYRLAEDYLQRAILLSAEDASLMYLRAILLYRQGLHVAAEGAIQRMLDIGYDDPYVRLLLADIYQYGLDREGDAAALLETLIGGSQNEEIRERLDAIRGQ